jgi:hypothetical protein
MMHSRYRVRFGDNLEFISNLIRSDFRDKLPSSILHYSIFSTMCEGEVQGGHESTESRGGQVRHAGQG